MRDVAPVHQVRIPNGTTACVVTVGHERTRALLTDPRLSKDSQLLNSTIRGKLAAIGQEEWTSAMFGPSMLMSDPPDHTRLRALVAGEFTGRRTAAMRPRVEQLTADLLDVLPVDEKVDLIRAVAFPLPITVISDLLGVPGQDRYSLRRWTEDMMRDVPEITRPASAAMMTYLGHLIGQKQADPGDDLLSALTLVSVDGDRLSPAELMATAVLLIVAGHETTTNLIGNMVFALLAQPDLWHAVAADPARLVPVAIEETLRWDPPVRHATHRVATEPVDIAGTVIPAGELVLINLGTAGRDPVTGQSAEYTLHGSARTRQHASFGHGIHYCLGSQLARMEADACLTQLVTRWPDARLAVAADEVTRSPSVIMNGLAELPVHFA